MQDSPPDRDADETFFSQDPGIRIAESLILGTIFWVAILVGPVLLHLFDPDTIVFLGQAAETDFERAQQENLNILWKSVWAVLLFGSFAAYLFRSPKASSPKRRTP